MLESFDCSTKINLNHSMYIKLVWGIYLGYAMLERLSGVNRIIFYTPACWVQQNQSLVNELKKKNFQTQMIPTEGGCAHKKP